MRLLRMLSVSVLTLSMGLINADAQNLRNTRGPAETPPASFKGKQYVDSRGCVFIRAGFGGQVTWVPRVTRDRKQVCGARSTAQPRVAAKPREATKVVRGKPPKNAQVVSRTVKVIKPKAAPKPATQTVRRTKQQPKIQTRVVRKQAVVPKQQAKVVRRPATAQPKIIYRCSGASKFSAQFVNKGARCGPQDGHSRTVIREEISPQSSNTQRNRAGEELKGPKGVNRRIAQSRIPVPKGFKKAWKDGRLSPMRGVGTTSGKAQMALVWSNTVPRYLIDPATGKRAN